MNRKNISSTTDKPYASVSLDLDNQWSYMKTFGKSGWDTFPSYFEMFIPHVLEMLDHLELKITFFLVGRDLQQKKNYKMLRLLTDKGHEIGNHSFDHEVWIHKKNRAEIEKDLATTEECLMNVCGQKPIGFRGPGFAWSSDLFKVLIDRGYLYDTSTFPTFIGPLARIFFSKTSELTEDEMEKREGIYGKLQDGFRPVKPYFWQVDSNARILEIPVTTIPIFKLPFHQTYLLYVSRVSSVLMKSYLKTALSLCRVTGLAPTFLLHPTDLISGDQVREMDFFPGMDISSKKKTDLFITVMEEFKKHYSLINMSTHAQLIAKNKKLKIYHANK